MQSMIPGAIPIILVLFSDCLSLETEAQSLRDHGAEEIQIGEVPYVVSIIQNNNHICGGIIIEKQWIITTAHCVEDKYGLEIQAGLVNLLNPGRYLQKIEVEEVFLHPFYVKRDESEYNIALLLLGKELVFNLAVESISILSQTQLEKLIATHEPAIISGWGSSESADASVSNRLYSGEIELFSNEECEVIFPNCDEFVPDAHLCSSTLTSEKLSGFLDNGGPLVVMDKLGGFIIHGKQNKNKNRPILSTVYAGIPFHASFIQSHLPHLYPANEDHFSVQIREKTDSLKFDLILVSVPTTNSDIKTFIINYKIHFPESWNIANPEEKISSLSPKCSKNSVVDKEKWILSIEIVKSNETPEVLNTGLLSRFKYTFNMNLAKYIN